MLQYQPNPLLQTRTTKRKPLDLGQTSLNYPSVVKDNMTVIEKKLHMTQGFAQSCCLN